MTRKRTARELEIEAVRDLGRKADFLELKSSPRIRRTVFVMDTALRLGDKVVPMLQDELCRRRREGPVCRNESRESCGP